MENDPSILQLILQTGIRAACLIGLLAAWSLFYRYSLSKWKRHGTSAKDFPFFSASAMILVSSAVLWLWTIEGAYRKVNVIRSELSSSRFKTESDERRSIDQSEGRSLSDKSKMRIENNRRENAEAKKKFLILP